MNMHRTHLKSNAAALRMFPRLAAKPPLNQPATFRRTIARQHPEATSACDATPSTNAQLRLRLLNMIIDNERIRRQEPHAS
jgi:hypothetical protein